MNEEPVEGDVVGTELVVPGVGTVVDTRDMARVVEAIDQLRFWRMTVLDRVDAQLRMALLELMDQDGLTSARFERERGGVLKVTVDGAGASSTWFEDPRGMRDELIAAGVSEQRAHQAVRSIPQPDKLKLDRSALTALRRARPEYEAVISRHERRQPRRRSIKVDVDV